MKSRSGLVSVDGKHVKVGKGFRKARNIVFIDFMLTMALEDGNPLSGSS